MERLLLFGLSNAVLATMLALLAVTVAAIGRRPALAHGLWLLVLLKLVTPPLVPISVPWPGTGDSVVVENGPLAAATAPFSPQDDGFDARFGEGASLALADEFRLEIPGEWVVEEAPDSTLLHAGLAATPTFSDVTAWLANNWAPLVGTLWLAGAAAWYGLALLRIGRFYCLLRHAQPAPAALQDEARELAARLGLEDCPSVELLPGAISPMLWTLIGRPRLLLPESLLGRLKGAQRATLITHELAHLRRRDQWVRALELLATGLYWWHPVVWWARRELREAEEQCCDAWVVWALPGAARDYAAALLETIDFLSETRVALPPAASGIGHVTLLKRRLTMIMQANTPRAVSWGGFLILMGLGTVWLPTWVQAEPPSEEREKVIKELQGLRKQVQDEKVNRELERLIDMLKDSKKVEGKREFRILLDGKDFKFDSDDFKGHAKEMAEKAKTIAEKAKAQAKEHAEHAKQLQIQIHKHLGDVKHEEVEEALGKVRVLLADKAEKGDKDSKKGDDGEKSKDLKKAEDEFKAAQKQFQDAVKRFVDAQMRFNKAGGKAGVWSFSTDGKGTWSTDGKATIELRGLPGTTEKKEFRIEVGKPGAGAILVPKIERRALTIQGGDSEKRISDLEKRLSEMLNEVKSLRQDLKKTPRSKSGSSSSSSSSAAPVPPAPPIPPVPAVRPVAPIPPVPAVRPAPKVRTSTNTVTITEPVTPPEPTTP